MRLIARCIDSLILGVVPFLLIMGMLIVSKEENLRVAAYAVSTITGILIFQVYYVSIIGQSFGKMLLGIRIVDQQTQKTGGFAQNVLLRTIGNAILGIIPFYGLIDVLLIFRADKRCVHDHLAGTIVLEAQDSQLRSKEDGKGFPLIPSLLTLLVLGLSLVIVGTMPVEQSTETVTEGETQRSVREYTSLDGTVTVSASVQWQQVTDLNDEASLQFQDPQNDLYAILLGEPKEDFDTNLEGYATLILRNFEQNAPLAEKVSGPVPSALDGFPAVQYEYTTTVDSVKATLLFTFVESDEYYHQILVWSTQSNFDANRAVFDELLRGFQFN